MFTFVFRDGNTCLVLTKALPPFLLIDKLFNFAFSRVFKDDQEKTEVWFSTDSKYAPKKPPKGKASATKTAIDREGLA